MIDGPPRAHFAWSKHAGNKHAGDNVRRLPLRARAVPRDGRPVARHRMQLLDLQQKRLLASDRCGIHAFYVPRSDPDKIDVNVRCLDDVDVAALKPHLFDGRHWEQSMAGRVPWK
jgi:hypothetical protein